MSALKRTNPLRFKLVAVCGAILALPFSLLALDPSRSVFQYNCQNWTRQNGLPVNGINAIAQTEDGYLWLGTHNGLIRFDGLNFQMVSLPESKDLRTSIIQCLTPTTGGGFWFGLQDSAYGRFDGHGTWLLGKDNGGSTYWNVRAILETQAGRLLVAGNRLSGWRQPDGAIESVFGPTPDDHTFNVLSGFVDAQDRIWLGTASQGLYYWQDGKLTKFPDPALDSTIITAITVDHDNQLWLGTSSGLISYDARFHRREIPFPGNQVNALLADREGVLWIGLADSGVARWKDNNFELLRKTDGLVSDSVLSLAEDREGSLWIGCEEGLSQLSDVKFPIYSDHEGMFGKPVNSVSASPRGGLLAATHFGITYFNGWGTNYSTNAGLANPYVKRVFEASDGDVFAISGRNEIEVLSGGKVVSRLPTQDMPVAMTEDAQGMVVSVGGELCRMGRDHIRPFPFANDQKPQLYWVLNLMTASDGAIWVASMNGICRIKDGEFQQWTAQEGLGDFAVRWICQDNEGVIWAGMPTGIARLKDNRITNIRKEDGLFDGNIWAMVPDDYGYLWVDSIRGLYRVSLQSLNDFADHKTNRVVCTAYDTVSAMKPSDKNGQENSACKTLDGRIWFPSQEGVVMVNPANVTTNQVPPPVHIQHVHVNGTDYSPRNAVNVQPGNGELEIQYTALSYIAPHDLRFRYQLEGYDPNWVQAQDRRSAFYTNLKPGKYAFRVQACNADGVWSPAGDSLTVTLPPHYYQTAWFRALCGLLSVFGVLGVYRGRVSHLRRKEQKLEEANERLELRVRERTEELAQQRNLLRTLIDHLPDNVFVKDRHSRVVLDNLAHANRLGVRNPDEVVGKTDFDFLPWHMAEKFQADEKKLLETGKPFHEEEVTLDVADGTQRWSQTTKVPLRDAKGEIIGLAGINRDITERKESEARLEALHKKLIEASRQAGMAEVATGVLHNVGNVLNSVSVSAGLVADRTKNSRTTNLAKVVALLREHRDDLGQFFSQERKGRQLISYIENLADHLATERSATLTEIEELNQNIEHIKEIVAMQQTYARASGVLEMVKPAELFEDALRMHAAAYQRHAVEVAREYSDTPPITADRHKVLQILVNLLHNAKYACDDKNLQNRNVTVRLACPVPDRVRFEVSDNGVGITPENLTRIFSHGFTTRKNGHGFGLHSGALAAKEMGGSLTAHSDGLSKGATFALELPLTFKPATHSSAETVVFVGVESSNA